MFGRCCAIVFCDWCYCDILISELADVVPSGNVPLFYNCCSGQFYCPWLMLLPLLIIVFGWCYCHIMIIVFGWCYCQVAGVIATVNTSSCLADVVAMVAYGMPTIGCGIADVIIKVADGMATGSMFKFQF